MEGWVAFFFCGLWGGHRPMLRKKERTATNHPSLFCFFKEE